MFTSGLYVYPIHANSCQEEEFTSPLSGHNDISDQYVHKLDVNLYTHSCYPGSHAYFLFN